MCVFPCGFGSADPLSVRVRGGRDPARARGIDGYACPHVRVRVRVFVCAYIYVYIHICLRTYIHVYVHTHIHLCPNLRSYVQNTFIRVLPESILRSLNLQMLYTAALRA
jgi:hypothetical protein